MHRLAYGVSGGLIVALSGPDEDDNPETRGDMLAMLAGDLAMPTSTAWRLPA